MSEPLRVENRDLSRQHYLRHNQVEELEAERSRLMDQVTARQSHLRAQDPGVAKRRIARITQQIEEQLPPALKGELLDRVASREKQLLDEILQGMPSQAEMRGGPSGSLGKHQQWEKRNKTRIIEWKNLRLILARSGAGGDYTDPDVANLESYRPQASSLNLDDCRVPRKEFVGTNPSPAYKEGWDRTFGDPDERIAKLREEIGLLERLKAAQDAESQSDGGEHIARCGKAFDNANSLQGHEARCQACKTA